MSRHKFVLSLVVVMTALGVSVATSQVAREGSSIGHAPAIDRQQGGNGAASLLDDPTRSAEDRERDPGSRPLDVYAWLGIGEGMAVGDLVPFGGYNTHLLSRVVGADGTVYAAYNIARQQPAFDERMARASLDNVVDLADLSSVPDDSVDAYITVRNVHDFYIPEIVAAVDLADRETVFREALRTLKPGGILGVVDARTGKEGVDAETHRINEARVIDDLEELGFELVERSEMLADPGDDHSVSSFPVRWNVDRFLLKFRKPQS